ncbi:MAG: HEAT repeat domain-containing protein [Planctomycetes bacterium]|nr:HEAT repeat domain-containing protein [Planctomycetota bacterium]
MLERGRLKSHIQALKSGTEASRRDTIVALKPVERADWDAIPNDLIKQVVDALRYLLPKSLDNGAKPPLFRQEIVTTLGNIGPRSSPALPQLVELLNDGVPDGIREATATALGKIGKESRVGVDGLIRIVTTHCRIALADRIARALGDIGCADQRVRTVLTNLWLFPIHSQSNQVQVAIAMCKLGFEAPGVLKFLTATLVSSRDSTLRKFAIEALSHCNKTDIDVVPALTAALYDDDEEVRKQAEGALTQMRLTQTKAILICAEQLKDATHAETALRKSGQLAVPALILALKSREPLGREKAARTLGSLGELALEAVPALTALLHDKQLEVRLAVAKALWNVNKNADAVVPVLADLLASKTVPNPDAPDARRIFFQTVIESLCRIGPSAKAAIPALNRKAKDENRLVRESAQRALREIGPPLSVAKKTPA